jgi:hypothetical protein
VLDGGEGNDILSGGSLDDILTGGSGNDTLSGGTGIDTLVGGAGADSFVDSAANLNGDSLPDFDGQDFIKVTGVRFGSISYDAATGTLSLDTDNNGSFETFLHMATGLNGAFRAQASSSAESASTSITYLPDTDGDGVLDETDNALYVPNPDQRDTDGDGYGNVVDADLNQDLVVDFFDLSMLDGVFGTNDPHADFNGDGSVDFFDLSILDGLFGGPPGASYVDGLAAGGLAEALALETISSMAEGATLQQPVGADIV